MKNFSDPSALAVTSITTAVVQCAIKTITNKAEEYFGIEHNGFYATNVEFLTLLVSAGIGYAAGKAFNDIVYPVLVASDMPPIGDNVDHQYKSSY